jgi:ribosomal protein S18 acetylase RimI-like enzyme
MEVHIKKLGPGDTDQFAALINVFEEVFGMENLLGTGPGYLESLLKKESFMVYVALFGERVIGGLTAYVLPSYYFQSSEVYIYDLAVDPVFRRKGTGRKLIEAVKADCRALGLREVVIQADGMDQHAIDFYHATGGKSADVVHFSYPL